MQPKLIHHVGILVANLEEAIERWERITGYTFGPIHRYRSSHYRDSSEQDEHLHDARLSFSREGTPHIELLEATGTGTHGAANLGVHHLAFVDYGDLEAEHERVTGLGLQVDGRDVNDAGELLLFFTDPPSTDHVRLEFVAPRDHPNVMDDGSPMWRDPSTGRFDAWGPDGKDWRGR
ncbi:VOC family protein [Actinotalea sp. M2MS4P-6]|uniref:VOC family protein n=1 Tax=Actinotalea sp. M2MS4P-6 TaxID=2983762 RepID=UPI0021E4D50F|nr:VOC family protein [Actinotalea sp. M2MS4P-6]MCV2395136.1 VOC family protein [Actinotalea sp. M2MS4P-6]